MQALDVHHIRELFPITQVILPATSRTSTRPLVFLDHGASTHAPTPVLETYEEVMRTTYSNVHRAKHTLSQQCTNLFEDASPTLARLAGIQDLENSGMEVIITTNTTSSLDIASHIASQWPGAYLTTGLEHHSNDLPHRRRGETLHINLTPEGRLDYNHYEQLLQQHQVKLVAVSAASNVTGYMPEIHRMARLAHNHGARILVDAAQRLAHCAIDVKSLDHPEHIDFLAGGGHKMYAPFGASFLLCNQEDADNASPYLPSGGTVNFVTLDDVIYTKGPERHMPGTPNIAGTIALARSAEFLMEIGLSRIRQHELHLLDYTLRQLKDLDRLILLGNIRAQERVGVISFNIRGLHHPIVSQELDEIGGIATRNGCFCAHPYLMFLMNCGPEKLGELMENIRNGIMGEDKRPGAVRATIGMYNTKEELDTFVETVEKIIHLHPLSS